jgi:hypothetical protein
MWRADLSGGSHEAALAIVAIADGHGGGRHFRSAVGAKLAVRVATQILRDLARAIDGAPAAERVQRVATAVPSSIVGEWVARARAHLQDQPISFEEWRALDQSEGEAGVAAVRLDPLIAYGATVLAALVTPACIVLLQLGDGDVLVVSTDGSVRRPIAADTRLAGNLTTSICHPGAADDFRVSVLVRAQEDPALVLLSTDGYANSFRTDADFLRVGTDFQALIVQHGLTAVGQQMESILTDASRSGSGDDVSVALLNRALSPQEALAGAALTTPPSPPPRSHAAAPNQELADALRQIVLLRRGLAASLAVVVVLALWLASLHLPLGGQSKRPDPTLPPSALPTFVDPGPSNVASGVPGAAAPEAASAITIDHAHAARAEHGIEVSATLSALPADPKICKLQATVWGVGDKELNANTRALSADMVAGFTISVPYPPEAARAQAMHQDGAQFSIRVDCGGRAVAKKDKQAIGS